MIKDRIWTLVSRKLSGEATASELTELANLVNGQVNTDLYLQAMAEFWKIPTENDDDFLEATYHLHLKRLKQKGFDLEADKENEETGLILLNNDVVPSRGFIKKGLIAAGIISSLVLVFFFGIQTPEAGNTAAGKIVKSEVSTKSGSRTKISLPDGSSVWLNGGSRLTYDNEQFGVKGREVILTGEAYFDVVKNSNQPFIIHANKIVIRVLGTAFNVKAYPGEKNTETSLIRGSLEVTIEDRKGKITLNPNDKLIVSNDEPAIKNMEVTNKKGTLQGSGSFMSLEHLSMAADESTVLETAWVENKLVFDEETFEEVALKMERWYGVSIRFSDEALKTQRLTGTFEKETVTEALQALQIATPIFKYRINNQTINIFK